MVLAHSVAGKNKSHPMKRSAQQRMKLSFGQGDIVWLGSVGESSLDTEKEDMELAFQVA